MIHGPPSFKYHEGFGRFVFFITVVSSVRCELKCSRLVVRKRLYNIVIFDEYCAMQPIDKLTNVLAKSTEETSCKKNCPVQLQDTSLYVTRISI